MSKREPIPSDTRRSVMVDADFRCHYCNRVGHADIGPGERPWHIDHKVPVVKGGTNDRDNLVLACKRCNVTKNARDYEPFLEFARAAYWVNDSEDIPAAVLDELANAWHKVANYDGDPVTWSHEIHESHRRRGGSGAVRATVFSIDESGTRIDALEGVFYSRNAGHVDAAEFLTLAIRHMPLLLGMVAKARSESPETERAA